MVHKSSSLRLFAVPHHDALLNSGVRGGNEALIKLMG